MPPFVDSSPSGGPALRVATGPQILSGLGTTSGDNGSGKGMRKPASAPQEKAFLPSSPLVSLQLPLGHSADPSPAHASPVDDSRGNFIMPPFVDSSPSEGTALRGSFMAELPPLVEHSPSEDTVLRETTNPQIPLTSERLPTPRQSHSLGKNDGVLLGLPGSESDATTPVHMPSPATGQPTDATGSALSLPAGPYGQSRDCATARTTMVGNFQQDCIILS